MSQDAPAPALRQSNPLVLPLIIVSIVAIAEAVGLIVLAVALARRPDPVAIPSITQLPAGASVQTSQAPTLAVRETSAPPAIHNNPADKGPSAAASTPTGANKQGFVVGKKGQRVESAGLGVTVEQINHEPMYKTLIDYGEDYRYLALLILVENNTGANTDLLPASFRLQDDQGYPYNQRGLKLTEPKLGIHTLGDGEKVRGYLDFVVPKSAKGLHLIYSHVPMRDSKPIHVELTE